MRRRRPLLVLGALLLAGPVGAACSRREESEVRGSASSRVEAIPSSSGPRSPAATAHWLDAAPNAQHGCIEINAAQQTGGRIEVDGVVASGRHSHPNGTSFVFHVLRLKAPRCVTGLPETTSVDELQLMAVDGTIKLDSFVGKNVHVVGGAFPEMTAWHVRPVLLGIETITKP